MAHSEKLIAENKRLHDLRARNGVTVYHASSSPADVGAHYARLAAEARQRLKNEPQPARSEAAATVAPAEGAEDAASVPIHPTIAAAMLRAEDVATGRAWLILHHVYNRNGLQLADLAELRQRMTAKGSDIRLSGESRLRGILAAGEGRYWERVKGDRLRIFGVTEVAKQLGVERVRGRVMLPLSDLTAGKGAAAAALYGVWHAGRRDPGAPISRAAIEDATGVERRTQIRYEQRRGIETTTNYDILAPYEPDTMKANAAHYGGAVFKLTDWHGLQGPAGRQYVARQIGNSYAARLERAPKGRQRRVNQALKDTVTNGGGGTFTQFDKLYYSDGAAAARAASRTDDRLLWPNVTVTSRAGRFWSGTHDLVAA